MNTKVIGSIVRWVLVLGGAITAFMSNESFMDAFDKLKEALSSGDTATIIGSAVTLITLGWSIWDKIKTQRVETSMKAQIRSLNSTVQILQDGEDK